VAAFLDMLALDMHVSDSGVSRTYDTVLGYERAMPDRGRVTRRRRGLAPNVCDLEQVSGGHQSRAEHM
jgi:hypothetical protein